MRKALNRLYQWIVIAPLRRNTPNHGNPTMYHYPTPGSVFQSNQPLDYKTSFQETQYNVRYAEPTINQTVEGNTGFASFNDNIPGVRKLVLLNFLKQSDVGNLDLVKEAKNKFKAFYGFDVDGDYIKNDMDVKLPKNFDRQNIREFLEQMHIIDSIRNRENILFPLQDIQKPDIIQFQSFDMYDAAHFQQNRVQLEYTLDLIRKGRAEAEGGLITREGSANYWKVLDDSNDPQNIKKVQQKIGDKQPTNFGLNLARVKFQFDKDGNVVDFQRIKEKAQ